MTNLEKLAYLVSQLFKVHLWNAGTDDERFAQNNFIGRIANAVAARTLDWEVPLGGDQKSSLRTIIRWMAADFADVKARLEALSAQVAAATTAETTNGPGISREEQAAIFERVVAERIGVIEVRQFQAAPVQAPDEGLADVPGTPEDTK